MRANKIYLERLRKNDFVDRFSFCQCVIEITIRGNKILIDECNNCKK